MIRIKGIKVSVDDNISILELLSRYLSISKESIRSCKVLRRAIDYSQEKQLYFKYTLLAEIDNFDKKMLNKHLRQFVTIIPELPKKNIKVRHNFKRKPIIIGMGPAGLFCAYILAKNNQKPIIVDKGSKIEKRIEEVNEFWKFGILNTESNVQFGEGGAGTFSDGKLTARISDRNVDLILDILVECGAHTSIKSGIRSHIGTDRLRRVIINLRNKLINLGVDFRYNTCVDDFIVRKGKIIGVKSKDSILYTDNVILSIGNSSRKTVFRLNELGIALQAKTFGVGVRVEHKREYIDKLKYRKFAGHPNLDTADYFLTYNSGEVYTFCMCPGGFVVGSSSENGGIVTNGMSNFDQMADNSNSAILVSIVPDIYNGIENPINGFIFQKEIEQKCFAYGGNNYFAPSQNLVNFLNDKPGGNIDISSYKPKVIEADFRDVFNSYIVNSLKNGIKSFDKSMKGFITQDAVLTAPETRSSSPVRILRNENFESVSIKGLYPCGEGSGYTGGIMGSALDGIKVGLSLLKKLQ